MSRDLYMVRHAEAIPRGTLQPDEFRWLTPAGRRSFYKTARRLARKEGRDCVEAVLTSPLARAVMTAELLARALRLSGPVEVHAELAPESPVSSALALLLGDRRSVAVVGHEPQLSQLLHELCAQEPGEARPEAPQQDLGLQKGGIAALRLDRERRHGRLRYLLE